MSCGLLPSQSISSQTLMFQPLVSVLMPLYNSSLYLAEAIESVCSESYENIEQLICDDASTDDSLVIARSYAAREPRIRLFTREQNSGSVSVVYRSLAESARGTYLIASDSDDVAMPRRLETLVKLAEHHPEASLVYGTVHAVSEDLAVMVFALSRRSSMRAASMSKPGRARRSSR